MKHRILYIIFPLLIVSCTSKIDYVIFSGTITNQASEKLGVYGNDFLKEIDIDSNGYFSDTLYVQTGYYTFNHKEVTSLYLKPGYAINMTLNVEEFDETIQYSGIGSEPNNYLKNKLLLEEALLPHGKSIYSLNETDFVSKVETLKDSLLNILENSSDLPESFISLEKRSNEYRFLTNLLGYPVSHRYYSGNDDYQLSDSLLTLFDNIDYQNELDFKNFNDYKYLVRTHFLYSRDLSNKDSINKAIETIKDIENELIKESLGSSMLSYLSARNEYFEDFYNGIIEVCKDSAVIAKATQKYHSIIKTLPGNPAPYFKYVTNHGDSLSIDDFKGKPVYIDVWATWCAPCIHEIPYLKKVEDQFHEEVHFVSISIDSDKAFQKWKDMIINKELGGTHLYAEGQWNATLMKEFAITGIPRFILLDENGFIIDANAPRPSNDELTELLNEITANI